MAPSRHLHLLLLFSATAWSLPADQGPPAVPEECRPPIPGEKGEDCCRMEVPSPSEEKLKVEKECIQMMLDLDHRPHPPPPPPGGAPPPPPPPGGAPPPPPPGGAPPPPPGGAPPPPHHHQGGNHSHPHPPPPGLHECLEECLFNRSGFLLPELKLNKEKVMTVMMEDFGKDEVWKPVVQEAVKTCLETAAGQVKDDAKCRSGTHQFVNCFRIYLFKNCPSEVWKESETCAKEKKLVEKCNDFLPPPPPKD